MECLFTWPFGMNIGSGLYLLPLVESWNGPLMNRDLGRISLWGCSQLSTRFSQGMGTLPVVGSKCIVSSIMSLLGLVLKCDLESIRSLESIGELESSRGIESGGGLESC